MAKLKSRLDLHHVFGDIFGSHVLNMDHAHQFEALANCVLAGSWWGTFRPMSVGGAEKLRCQHGPSHKRP